MTKYVPRSWPGYGPPLVAALVTFLLAGLVDTLGRGEYSTDGLASLLPILLLPLPFIVSVLWSIAQMTGYPGRLVLVAAASCVGLCLSQFSGAIVLQIGGQMAAGIMAGMALRMRWRLDVALVLVALTLTPALIWATLEMPVSEQFQLLGDQVMETVQENMPESADEKQRVLALAEQRKQWEDVAVLAEKFYPAFLTVGVFGQAGVILALI